MPSTSPDCLARRRRVREFVCTYRTLRDDQGQAVRLPSEALSDPGYSGRRPANDVRSTVQNITLLPGSTEDVMAQIQRSEDVGFERSFAPSGKRTLTDVEVAARLGVSRFTVRSWRLKGTGPRFLKMGRAVRYRPEDVEEYERRALVDTQAQSDRTPV